MKKLILILVFLPIFGLSQTLNFINYFKASDSINVGYDVNGKDTSMFILKSNCQSYQSAVQVFRMDTLTNVLIQINKSMTFGEPERILAYGDHGGLKIINLQDLPTQAKQILEGFKQEVATKIEN